MKIIRFLDKLEDKIRSKLSHWPILYAFLGGAGIVLFWRGIWHTADVIAPFFLDPTGAWRPTIFNLLDGPVTLFISIVLLLPTGLFVSAFIGNETIISGLRGEKRIAEKTEQEVQTETEAIAGIEAEVKKISERVKEIDSHVHKTEK